MRITIEPTTEMYEQGLADGRTVPLRIWTGLTDGGVEIEVYVFAITPTDPAQSHALQQELPAFMTRTRDLHKLDLG